jgi:hypothetical protein
MKTRAMKAMEAAEAKNQPPPPGGPQIDDVEMTDAGAAIKCTKCVEYYGSKEKNGLCTVCFVNTSIAKMKTTKLELTTYHTKVAFFEAQAMDEAEMKTLLIDHTKCVTQMITEPIVTKDDFKVHVLIGTLLSRLPKGQLFTVKQLHTYLSTIRTILHAHNLLIQNKEGTFCLDDHWSIFCYYVSNPWDGKKELEQYGKIWVGLDNNDNCTLFSFLSDYLHKINTTDLKQIVRSPGNWTIRTTKKAAE